MSDHKEANNSVSFSPKLGFFASIVIVVSSMIGSGIFKKIAPMAYLLNSPLWVILAWIFAGFITLCGALTNAEVAGLIASPGGQYVYFQKMYGKGFAFLYGWANFAVIQSATIASVSYVFAESANALFKFQPIQIPLPSNFVTANAMDLNIKLISIAIIIVLSTINYRGLVYGKILSSTLTVGIVMAIFTIISLGLISENGSYHNIINASSTINQTSFTDYGFFTAFFAAMLSAFWAYEGWNNLTFLGGEITNPHRNIPLSLITGVSMVTILYALTNLVFIYVLPIKVFTQIHIDQSEIAAIAVVKQIMGQPGILFISILILIATFGSTHATILTASRVYYAMAKDKLFIPAAGNMHPKYQTPSYALVIQCIWACILVISGSFDQLTDMLIFASFLFYGASGVGLFILRIKLKDIYRPYKTLGYPFTPTIFIIFCACLVIASLIERPYESLVGLCLIFAGIPMYYYWNKKSITLDI